MIKEKDKKFLMKVWRDGKFKTHKFFGIREIIERLEKLGVIIKIDFFNYSVNRERYIELENQEPKPIKQEKLFKD